MAVTREDIAAALRERITSGAYKAGERLPSIRAIAEEFGASRTTANLALRLLADEGLIEIRTKSAATVLFPAVVDRAPEARLASARDELRAIQGDVHEARVKLEQVEKRVAATLSELGGAPL